MITTKDTKLFIYCADFSLHLSVLFVLSKQHIQQTEEKLPLCRIPQSDLCLKYYHALGSRIKSKQISLCKNKANEDFFEALRIFASMSTYYELLEITEIATEVEIKKAYRRMAKLWHPDMNPNEDTTQQFVSIEVAYSALSDSKSRAAYDRLLQMERERIINPGLNRKYAQTVTKRTSQTRKRANTQSNMSYEQYQREEMLRTSLWGIFLKAAFFLITAVLIFWWLIDMTETRSAQIRARQVPSIPDTLFVILFFLPLPLLIILTYAYEPLVKLLIVGSPKGKRKKKK